MLDEATVNYALENFTVREDESMARALKGGSRHFVQSLGMLRDSNEYNREEENPNQRGE